MSMPISLRLNDGVRETLEAEARARHIGLSTYVREIVTDEARRVQRERIRQQSRAVGEYVSTSPDAGAFFDDWGSSDPIGGG